MFFFFFFFFLLIEGLGGSCVIIPCNFHLPMSWESALDNTCKAIWKRGSWSRIQVFDSSLTGANANVNIVQGNLTGNLLEKDCTTIFHNLPSNHYDDYYFRLECDNNSLSKPTITPSRVEVEEGSSVKLSCSAPTPCPILPPSLTWTPGVGESEEQLENKAMTSVVNFTASPLHHRQKITCAALYKRQAGTDLLFEKSLTISVFYPPNNTSVSLPGPVLEDDSVTLTCSSNANPSVDSYTWYRVDGDQVTASGPTLVIDRADPSHSGEYYCEAKNDHGEEKSTAFQLDVQNHETTMNEIPQIMCFGQNLLSIPDGDTISRHTVQCEFHVQSATNEQIISAYCKSYNSTYLRMSQLKK
uniref:Ig-like domain-containing protein n=1 Tax=Myripristis murdjan TaxID=586833 RepID=A0A668A641_9TELE